MLSEDWELLLHGREWSHFSIVSQSWDSVLLFKTDRLFMNPLVCSIFPNLNETKPDSLPTVNGQLMDKLLFSYPTVMDHHIIPFFWWTISLLMDLGIWFSCPVGYPQISGWYHLFSLPLLGHLSRVSKVGFYEATGIFTSFGKAGRWERERSGRVDRLTLKMKYILWKIHMKPINGGLEDSFPFQLGDF